MKRIIVFLSFCLLLNAVVSDAQSVSTWDGSAAEWTHGSGTQADPYLIESAANLAWIAEMVNGGVSTYANTYFKLTTDLNMNNVAWVPIGNSTTNLFRGKFDGDNHFIDKISITGNYTYKGLFGITGNGFRCENLGVNTTISSSTGGGGVVGQINGSNTVIEHCYNTGNTRGGGIVGTTKGSGTIITACYNTGNISSSIYAAGIIRSTASGATLTLTHCYNTGTITSTGSDETSKTLYAAGIIADSYSGNVVISHCHNEGSVSVSATSTRGLYSSEITYGSFATTQCGGIVGNAGSGTTVSHCYNKGSISALSTAKFTTTSDIDVTSDAYSGGIVGVSSGAAITYCYNKGLVTATAHTLSTTSNSSSFGTRTSNSGGIIGYSYRNCNVTNSYNRGNVEAYAHYGTSNTTSGTRIAGGIKGTGAGTIANCYNTGTLTGGTKGGIRGTTDGTVTNCYYISTCGGSVSGGTSKTEAVIKSTSFPILLNADSTIYIMDITPNANDGYPIFGNGLYVLTIDASSISFRNVQLNGVYSGTVDVIGFEYKKTSNSSYTTVYANVGSPATYQLTGLTSGTTYSYHFFVQKDGMSYYGEEKTFTTRACDVQATVTKSANQICSGSSATFIASGTSSYSNQFTYRWSNGSTQNSISVSNASTYTVTVSDANGCSATATASVTVNPVPSGSISGNTSLCAGESTTLTASGGNSYRWNTGATTPVITVSESGTYTCTFTNSYGCASTKSVTVSVFSAPIISGNTSFCQGATTVLTASGGNSYRWSTGATTATINVSSAGTYTVTATSSNGCTASSSSSITVNPLPNVAISGNNSFCQGASTTLTASGGNSYRWSTNATTATINVSATGTYTVTATSSNGCTASTSSSVSVNPLPNVAISGNNSFCHGSSTTLTASGGNFYQWSNNATTASINVNAVGTYTVTATSSSGCSASSSVSIMENQPTPISITGNTVICDGVSTALTATAGVSYLWSSGGTSQTVNVSSPGVYSVSVTDNNGCVSTASRTVSTMAQPVISGNTRFCAGQSTTLSVSGTGSYLWSNNATTSSIEITDAGAYAVTVSLPNGCTSSATANVTVAALPTPTISGNTILCQGQSTTLTANGGTSYLWSNASTQNSITVSQSGIYTVTATSAENCSATANAAVTVNPLPNITISGNTSTCQGNQVILTANGAQSYQWNTGSTNATIMVGATGNFNVIGYSAQGCSNTASTSVSVYPTYNTPISQSICEGETYNFFGQNLTTAGTYTYPLYSVHGCDSIITLTLTVREVPVVSISGNTSFCQGENSTLVANGGVSYNWSTGSTGSNLYVSESGAYTVTATNAQGCSATATTYVTVNELPTITISGNTAVCQGNTTTLTANGAATYQWSNGANGANNTVDVFGNYTVTGTSAAGCSSTATTTVIVYSLPVINISGDTEICQGSSTTLTANGAETYLWNNGTTDATLTTSNAGTYTVIGTDEHGCYSTESVDVVVYYPTDEDIYVSETGSYEWHDSTYTESGDYTWTGQTIHGCDSVVTLHLTITPTDTTGIATYDGRDLTLYPNPTTGLVTIRLNPETCNLNPEIRVFDIYGRRLQMISVAGETTQIDLSQYATGIYLVKLVNDGKVVATGKVVKQ